MRRLNGSADVVAEWPELRLLPPNPSSRAAAGEGARAGRAPRRRACRPLRGGARPPSPRELSPPSRSCLRRTSRRRPPRQHGCSPASRAPLPRAERARRAPRGGSRSFAAQGLHRPGSRLPRRAAAAIGSGGCCCAHCYETIGTVSSGSDGLADGTHQFNDDDHKGSHASVVIVVVIVLVLLIVGCCCACRRLSCALFACRLRSHVHVGVASSPSPTYACAVICVRRGRLRTAVWQVAFVAPAHVGGARGADVDVCVQSFHRRGRGRLNITAAVVIIDVFIVVGVHHGGLLLLLLHGPFWGHPPLVVVVFTLRN